MWYLLSLGRQDESLPRDDRLEWLRCRQTVRHDQARYAERLQLLLRRLDRGLWGRICPGCCREFDHECRSQLLSLEYTGWIRLAPSERRRLNLARDSYLRLLVRRQRGADVQAGSRICIVCRQQRLH